MNTTQLQALLASVPLDNKGQPLRCVIKGDDVADDLQFTLTKMDANGTLVDASRRAVLMREPYALEEAKETYEQDVDYWKMHYPTFEDFYAWLESDRQREIKLVDEAVDVVLLHTFAYEA